MRRPIYPLPAQEFGYPAEGGTEFVPGDAPVTRALMREAQLSLSPTSGTRWSVHTGALLRDEAPLPHADRFYQALRELKADLPIAEFPETDFAGPRYNELRRSITRTVEGYDTADPHRASAFALREEWMGREQGRHGRIAEGYGALIEYLVSQCRQHGATIHLGAVVTVIDADRRRIAVHCNQGAIFETDAAILTVSLPVLSEIALPAAAREKAAAGADIGFGNVVNILVRFGTKWWADHGGRDLADRSVPHCSATVPTWWTQHPTRHPVLTGWFAGPKADTVARLAASELVEMGLASLADIFDLTRDRIRGDLVPSRGINWRNDPFARGAYCYATPKTREAQSALERPDGDAIFFPVRRFTPARMWARSTRRQPVDGRRRRRSWPPDYRRFLRHWRQPRRTHGRTASISSADEARRGPSPSSTGGTIVTPQASSLLSDACASGWLRSGAFKDGPTITGVPRPIASATTDSARLSAMPCASLLSELKLHGANSTTPRGGRGRMARSKYDWTTCARSTSARSRDATTREAFGVGIAMTVEKPSATNPRRSSGQRAAVVVPLSTR